MQYAVIGYGKMGKLYDHLLQSSYIVDQFPVRKRVFFGSVEEFTFYKPDIDLVIVTSSSNTHYHITRNLLLCNYNVLVEKPICLSSAEVRDLESIAQGTKLVLYQSTLERYNPLIKYFKEYIREENIERIESYRSGPFPKRFYVEDAKFDLGIHDVDLFYYLIKHHKVPWNVHAEFGVPRREIKVYLKNHNVLNIDLSKKVIRVHNREIDFSSSTGNPILEMVNDITRKGVKMNEKWSTEISAIENSKDGVIHLGSF